MATVTEAAPTQKIRVKLAQRQFEFTLAYDYLFFRSTAGNGSIKRTACSEPLIQEFWRSGTEEIQMFPKIKAGAVRPVAEIDNERHFLRSLRSPAAIASLDGKFRALQFQERRKCKGK